MHIWTWILGLVSGALAFDAICLALAFSVGERADRSLNIMAPLLGMALSVPIGLLLTPANAAETSQFGAIGQAVMTFTSGYLVAKLDRTAEKFLGPDVLLNAVGGFRIIAFIGCLALGVATVYSVRRYLPW